MTNDVTLGRPITLKILATLLVSAAVSVAPPPPVLAQSSPRPVPTHGFRLVKLPNGDYTIPLSELEASGTSGKVTLHPQGLKTIVSVFVFGNGNHKHILSLKSGSDCVRSSATAGIALNPALTGQSSRTIVSVPIDRLTSRNFLVDVRNATTRRQFEEACAKI